MAMEMRNSCNNLQLRKFCDCYVCNKRQHNYTNLARENLRRRGSIESTWNNCSLRRDINLPKMLHRNKLNGRSLQRKKKKLLLFLADFGHRLKTSELVSLVTSIRIRYRGQRARVSAGLIQLVTNY